MAFADGPDVSHEDRLFGELVVSQGLCTREKVVECLTFLRSLVAAQVTPRPTLGELLVRRRYISSSQVEQTLRAVSATQMNPIPGVKPSPSPKMPEEAAQASKDPENEVGKYVRVLKLGAGGMGEVWKAWDTGLHRWVALKFLKGGDDDEIARFKREAQTAGRLSHPNIAAIHEVGESRGRHWIAMEFVPGQTLKTFPRKDKKTVVRLVRDAAQALAYAHEEGITHRDVKPENLMVVTRGKPPTGRFERGKTSAEHHVFVMDFGLARQTEGASDLSVSGLVVGTAPYMAPEQARGETVDARADVWSLGATLYELLTDRRPFSGANVMAVLKAVQEIDPKAPRKIDSRIDPDLETIVARCMEKDPARRYGSALELADELGRYLRGDAILAHPPSLLYRVRKQIARHPVSWGLAAGLLLAVLAGILVARSLLGESRISARLAELVARAERAYEAGRYEDARRLSEEVLSIDPARGEARFWLARVLLREYQMERGVPQARVVSGVVELLPLRPENLTARRLRERVSSLVGSSDAHRSFADSVLGLFSGQFTGARETLEKLPVDAPGGWEADFYRALTQYLAGDYEAARTLLSPHRTRDPAVTTTTWVRILLALAQHGELFGRDMTMVYEQALAATNDLPGEMGGVLRAQVLLAQARFEQSNGRDPERLQAQAIDLVKGNISAEGRTTLGDALLARAEYGASRGRIDLDEPAEYRDALSALEIKDDSGLVDLKRAEVLLSRWTYQKTVGREVSLDLEAAQVSLNTALQLNAAYVEAAIRRVTVTSELERQSNTDDPATMASFDLEISQLSEVAKNFAGYAMVHQALAKALKARGQFKVSRGKSPATDYEAAILALERALRRSPSNVTALLERAGLHQSWGYYEMSCGRNPASYFQFALDEYGKALAINSSNFEGYLYRAGLSSMIGDSLRGRGLDPSENFQAGLADVDRAISLNSKHADAYETRADLLNRRAHYRESLGENPLEGYQLALEECTKAIAINPKLESAYRGRGTAYNNMAYYRVHRGENAEREYKAAIAEDTEAIRINPKLPYAYVARGISLQDLAFTSGADPTSGLEAAIADMGKAAQLGPGDFQVYLYRGQAYAKLALVRQGRSLDPTPQFKSAIADYQRTTEVKPDLADAYTRLGTTHRRLGTYLALQRMSPEDSFDAAHKCLSKAIELNPGAFENFNERAELLQEMGAFQLSRGGSAGKHWEAAIQDFGRAIGINPKEAYTFAQRGTLLLVLGRSGEGVSDLERAIALSPALKATLQSLLDRFKPGDPK